MTRYTAEQLEHLRRRWIGHREALRELVALMKAGADWSHAEVFLALMQALEPLATGIEEVEMDLRGVSLDGVDLVGVDLRFVDLAGANLVEANLTGADLGEANLLSAQMWQVQLCQANLWEADLSDADLRYADLTDASLVEAKLTGANLWEADLSGANLEKADLSGANLEGVSYTSDAISNRLIKHWLPAVLGRIPLVGRLARKAVGVTHFEYLDTTRIDFSRNAFLKRHIDDYQFIQAFKRRNRTFRWILYPLWKVTSDCGRSIAIWVFWAVAFIIGFSLVYAAAAWLPAPLRQTVDWAVPQIHFAAQKYHQGFWTPVFFSLATFTTSGFYGEAQLKNAAALFWTSLEVLLGYIMLGGLISIFANKLAQRA